MKIIPTSESPAVSDTRINLKVQVNQSVEPSFQERLHQHILNITMLDNRLNSLNDSIAYTSIGCYNPDWSSPYTIADLSFPQKDVSKSIELIEDMDMDIDMTTDTRPVHLHFNRNLPDYYFSDEANEHRKKLTNNIICCSNWGEISSNMKLKPKTMSFHVSELEHSSAIEIVNMVRTLRKLLDNDEPITITAAIEPDTPSKLIKELQKNEIFGIIPSVLSFPKEDCLRGLLAQWNNIPYWPKNIIDQLPGAKKNNRKDNNEISLTPRQEQILNLIKERGASNKVIAKTLNITESTVKLHVGVILKKFNVKNRTQLALFGKK